MCSQFSFRIGKRLTIPKKLIIWHTDFCKSPINKYDMYCNNNTKKQDTQNSTQLPNRQWQKASSGQPTCSNCFIHSADFGSSGNNSTSFIAHNAPVSLSRSNICFRALEKRQQKILKYSWNIYEPIGCDINASKRPTPNKFPFLPLAFHWQRFWLNHGVGKGSGSRRRGQASPGRQGQGVNSDRRSIIFVAHCWDLEW